MYKSGPSKYQSNSVVTELKSPSVDTDLTNIKPSMDMDVIFTTQGVSQDNKKPIIHAA